MESLHRSANVCQISCLLRGRLWPVGHDRDSYSTIEDIIEFAITLDNKYAAEKFIRRLKVNCHVALLANEISMALIPKEPSL